MTEKSKEPATKGKARFELGRGGKTLSVHVDRQGFRRLVQTLERLAETGERQTFEKSGRRPSGVGNRSEHGEKAPDKLVFHIDDGQA
ncbi:MAG: hypothetical protein AAF543_19925 [Pseudomonadota bacterium]